MPGNLVTYLANISKWVDGIYTQNTGLSDEVASTSQRIVGGSILLLFILMVIAVLVHKKSHRFKFSLFTMMTTVTIGSVLILITSSIYLTVNSASKGLVKRQAGIEFWVCGNELNLIDPVGNLSQKIGSSTLYEENDSLVHIEGIVEDRHTDGTLGRFMHEIGGAVSRDVLAVPVNPTGTIFSQTQDGDGPSNPYPKEAEKFISLFGNSRYIEALNNQTCHGAPAEVQVFVYRYNDEDNTYEQTKLKEPRDYIFSDQRQSPPGDCVIVEFDNPKGKTDKLCDSYGKIDLERCQDFGVPADERDRCTATQINYSPIGTGMDPNIDKEALQ